MVRLPSVTVAALSIPKCTGISGLKARNEARISHLVELFIKLLNVVATITPFSLCACAAYTDSASDASTLYVF